MKNITDKFQVKQSTDTQQHVTWDDQVIGMIQCSPELGQRWEYVRYSQYPAAFIGTYEECCDQARKDYAAAHQPAPNTEELPSVTVVTVGEVNQPTYLAYRGTWKQYGPGFSRAVLVRYSNGKQAELWIPATVARTLRPGLTMLHYEDPVTHENYLRWPKRPVRRQAVAA
ncbi:MAG: hypothetical protein AAGJ95_10395 [Cyanobacteria bacterium J06554_11]